ncbi:MAG TPA: radical SAM protein [Planctomycetota bacterium]|nr:radical SAM protein [Planctomycetota bacterium]
MPPPGHLLIKPVGAACNLACSYCFYRQAAAHLPATGAAMAPELLEKIVAEALAARPEVAVFGWQGGEPTLAGLDFFRRVVEIQSRTGSRGQRVGNALQTNGLLIDDEWAKFLAEWRFLVGLSIDGPEPVHDANRRKSWRRAMDAAEHLRRRGVAFNVLTVLTEESAARGAELYRWFVSEGFTDLQFIPCVEPAALGRPAGWDARLADFSVSGAALGRFLTESFEEWRASGYGRGVSERTFVAMLARAAGRDPGLCTFAPDCSSYLLIEREGQAYPCDFFARPEWLLGSAAGAGLAELAASPLRAKFAGLKASARAACGDCPWWGLCHGGCPKDRAAVGAFDRPSPLCAGYRAFFEAAAGWFDSEGRRLAERCRLEEAARREALARPAGEPRPVPAAGRNDPCPCGSGRKFKRCCGK